MTKELLYQAILKFVLGVVAIGILIFLPAGTFDYWSAWLFMGILFVPMFFVGIVMMFKNPELLKKRLNAKEQQPEQNLVIKLSGLMFVMGLLDIPCTAQRLFCFFPCRWCLAPLSHLRFFLHIL